MEMLVITPAAETESALCFVRYVPRRWRCLVQDERRGPSRSWGSTEHWLRRAL